MSSDEILGSPTCRSASPPGGAPATHEAAPASPSHQPVPVTREPVPATHVRVAIIGAGFAGIGTGVALKRAGVDFVILERATDVGGTWRDNAYPGCQCDVPSSLYSFSFAMEPNWQHTYARQPEIEAYLRRCANQFGIRPHIRFGHNVEEARWDSTKAHWTIRCAGGSSWTADMLVAANGPLSEPKPLDVPGLHTFEGTICHSAAWNHDHDLTGERVAVIGTGASAIQIVPDIQPKVGHLSVFQRTAPWVLPHPGRHTLRWERAAYRLVPGLQRLARFGVYCSRETLAMGMVYQPRLLGVLGWLGRAHLRRQVPDPTLRARLTPSFVPGCKRILLSNRYYPALSQPNVTLVTEPIVGVRPHGIVTADGAEHEVDTIVLATGFFVTDNPMYERIVGAESRSLASVWADQGMQAYLGTAVPGFPNMFLLAGPNTGIGHTSLVMMIEAQVRYLVRAITAIDALAGGASRNSAAGGRAIDVRPEVLHAYTDELQHKMQSTVWTTGSCASWYLDAQGQNPTLWPDWTWRFLARTRTFDLGDYVVVQPSDHPPIATRPATETASVGVPSPRHTADR